MLDFICSNQNQTSSPRRPLHGLFYLAVALHLLLIIWFLRKVLLALIRLSGDLPPTQQIGAIPPPRSIPSLLDSNEVAAAATPSISCAFIRPIIFLQSRQVDSSDSDCSDDERRAPMNQHFSYQPIQFLEIGDARLLVPASTERFRELVRGLPDAIMRRKAFEDAREDGGVYRLSDVPQNPWILPGGTETFLGPSELTNESTRTWVMKLKITTKLICSIWLELHGQDWQLCEEIKEELFAEVAGQSLDRLLEVACSFSDARLYHGNISQQLTIFDALVDVLFNIRGLVLNRSIEVADIFNKMVNAFKGIIDKATYEIHSSEECTIHRATIILIQAMGFFYRNRDMVKSIFDNGNDDTDPHSVMYHYWLFKLYHYWLSKLTEDAKGTFKEKGRKYVFILDNIYYFQQNKCHPVLLPSVLSHLNSQIERYITEYLNECWLPSVLSYQDGDSLNKSHRMSLEKFTGEIFNICDKQMGWKVQPALKYALRDKIVELIVPKYEEFSKARRANQSRTLLKYFRRTRTETQEDIGAELEWAIRQVFES